MYKRQILDVVDEGNRLIQFHYEGIFEEILDPVSYTHLVTDRTLRKQAPLRVDTGNYTCFLHPHIKYKGIQAHS